MITSLFVVLCLVVLLAIVFTYNKIYKLVVITEEAWANIDIQLQKRHETVKRLIPIVSTLKQCEKTLQQSVAALRSPEVKVQTVASYEQSLQAGLQQIMMIQESNPDLVFSDQTMLLMKHLAVLEDELQGARLIYNRAVFQYNNEIQQYPQLILARAFCFVPAQFFELSPQEQEEPSSGSQYK